MQPAQLASELVTQLLRRHHAGAAQRVLENVRIPRNVAVPHIRANEQLVGVLVDEHKPVLLEHLQIRAQILSG
ncbi:hypothetical protein [Mycobacterium branderi]|nr:hypothetical protein [Mycobacterium branderi]